ncbi:MAG: hypothetical protein D3909_16960 [Candidatus Electrothrix sp. ATG1]|nr:hypothetical protein [Candidatus Electrothrix sp. ATG1]
MKAKDRLHNLTHQLASLKTELKMAEQKNEQMEQVLCPLPDSERVGTAEEETFEEDDPLIYAEDGEKEKEKGDSTGGAERESSVTKSGEGSAEGSGEPGEEQDVSRIEEMLAGGSTTEEAIGEESGADPLVLTGETETASTTKEVSTESSPLMPEKQWSKNTFLYLVKETDTLWGLAERFYGDGKYYPVIMEQNPRLVISDIHDEEGLRFLNDRTLLKDMYQRRIEWRDGLTLWKHQVRAGETRQAIEERFAAPGASGRVLYEKEPDIRPGAIVRVILH